MLFVPTLSSLMMDLKHQTSFGEPWHFSFDLAIGFEIKTMCVVEYIIKTYCVKLFPFVLDHSSKNQSQISNPALDWLAGQLFKNRLSFLKNCLKQKETADSTHEFFTYSLTNLFRLWSFLSFILLFEEMSFKAENFLQVQAFLGIIINMHEFINSSLTSGFKYFFMLLEIP